MKKLILPIAGLIILAVIIFKREQKERQTVVGAQPSGLGPNYIRMNY